MHGAGEAVGNLSRDATEELIGRAEVGFHRAGDQHARGEAAGHERVATTTCGSLTRDDIDRGQAARGHHRRDALHRIHLGHDVDRELEVRRGVEAGGVDLRELEQARRLEQLDEQPAVRCYVLQSVATTSLERVQPGQRVLTTDHSVGSAPSRSTTCSSCRSTSRTMPSRSSGHSRIESKSRSRSGGVG